MGRTKDLLWKEIIEKEYEGYKVNLPDLPIKLSRNENPFDIPYEVKEEILKEILLIPWNRYPDGQSLKLRKKLAEFLGVSPDNLLVGTGSGELIQIIVNALVEKDDKVILPTPTFPLYEKILQQKMANIIRVYLEKENFSLDLNKVRLYFSVNPKLVVISNPNNPTGNFLIDKGDLNRIKDFPGFILIDEAYYEFSGLSFINYIKEIPNLIILRTFSKAFSAAGIRLGYLIANGKVVEFLNKYRLPYNINIFSQIAGEKLIEKWSLLKNRIDFIKKERERIYKEMKKINYIEVYPSNTNFILFRSPKICEIWKRCEEKGIALRDFSSEPLLDNCLRVSVGDKFENDLFINTLKEVCL